MNPTRKIFVSIGLLIVLALTRPALSQESVPDSPRYSLDDAIALVKESNDGKILRAETLRKNNRIVYEIRVITDDGRVRTISVDSQNGIAE